MKVISIKYIILFFSILSLSACSTYKAPPGEHANICRELNTKLMFNGNTSNIRNSEIADTQTMLIERQYEQYHCGE